jgi:DNA repair and recombination protein RAD52
MLDKEITDLLDKPLDPNRVKHRAGGGGMSLAYLKGHNVIDQANDIFGFGAWGYDILMVELVNISGDGGEVVGGYYAARVRLTVAGCVPITEEGVCPIQEGRNPRAKIDAHDMARKGAVTDAMKRAFRCYGDQFGNSLYDTDLIDGQPGTGRATSNNSNQGQQQPAQKPTAAPVQQSRPVASQQAAKPVTQPAPNVVHMGEGEKATEPQRTAIVRMAGKQGIDE